MTALLMVPVDRAWVQEREALLTTEENAIFRAARSRAATSEERAYWDEFIALREANLRRRGVNTRGTDN